MISVKLSKQKHMTCGLPFTQVITEKREIGGIKQIEVFLACANCNIERTQTVVDDPRYQLRYDIDYVIEESAYLLNAASISALPRSGLEQTVKQLTGLVEWCYEQAILPIGEFMAHHPKYAERLHYYDPNNSVICRVCGMVGEKGREEHIIHWAKCFIAKMTSLLTQAKALGIEGNLETRIQWFEKMRGVSDFPK